MSSESLPHPRLCNHCFLCRAFIYQGDTIALWDIDPYRRLSYQQVVGSLKLSAQSRNHNGITAMPEAGRGRLLDSYGICDYYGFCGCKPRGTINPAHVDCWKAANKRHSTLSLLHLARRASLLINGWQNDMGFPQDVNALYTTGLYGIDHKQETELGLLLARVSARLPPEVQAPILKSMAEDLVLRSLVTAVQVAAFLTQGGNRACQLASCGLVPTRLCASRP